MQFLIYQNGRNFQNLDNMFVKAMEIQILSYISGGNGKIIATFQGNLMISKKIIYAFTSLNPKFQLWTFVLKKHLHKYAYVQGFHSGISCNNKTL